MIVININGGSLSAVDLSTYIELIRGTQMSEKEYRKLARAASKGVLFRNSGNNRDENMSQDLVVRARFVLG
jgi:hypothetical protein